jgi:hypothetical protein
VVIVVVMVQVIVRVVFVKGGENERWCLIELMIMEMVIIVLATHQVA